MPHYDYRCSQCGKFTVYQGIKEKALNSCPTCGSPVHRLIGKNVNVVYKCSGFYCTDTHSSSGASSGTSAVAEAAASSADSKPAPENTTGTENATGTENKAVNA